MQVLLSRLRETVLPVQVPLLSVRVEFHFCGRPIESERNGRDSHNPLCPGQFVNALEGTEADLGSARGVRQQQSVPHSQRLS